MSVRDAGSILWTVSVTVSVTLTRKMKVASNMILSISRKYFKLLFPVVSQLKTNGLLVKYVVNTPQKFLDLLEFLYTSTSNVAILQVLNGFSDHISRFSGFFIFL